MTVGSVRYLAAGAAVLALMGCGDRDGASGRENAAAGVGSAAARAYVATFTTKNPDVCFREVTLKSPELKGPAGPGPRVPPTRVIVMIDGSGSMAGKMGDRSKLELAREAALGFVDGLPASVQTSLLVFGQQGDNSQAGKAQSCSAIDVLAPMSTDRGPLRAGLGQVRAVGWTPLAAGLERAEALLSASATPGEQVIYVVSDGEETCGGDPVAVARRINGGRTRAIVNVIGFNLPSGEAAKLGAVAAAGGGDFVNLSTRAELERYSARIREEIRQTDNEVAHSIARTDNRVATGIAITDAETCASILATDEETAMSIDMTDRETAGHPVAFEAEAEALLKARHDALRARVAAYRARLLGAEGETGRRNDAAAEAVR